MHGFFYLSTSLRELVAQTLRIPELDQLLREHVQRQSLRARLRADVVPVADVDGVGVELVLADDCMMQKTIRG